MDVRKEIMEFISRKEKNGALQLTGKWGCGKTYLIRQIRDRLVLHGGSHKEEQIKTMSDFRFFSLISDAEKMRTAKDILCFIYLLNRRHLLEHLKNCRNAETELQSWCNDIKARAAVI